MQQNGILWADTELDAEPMQLPLSILLDTVNELMMDPLLQGLWIKTAMSSVGFQMHEPRLLAVTHTTVADLLNDLLRPTSPTECQTANVQLPHR